MGFAVSQLLKRVVSVVLPPVCPATGEIVDGVGHLTPEAWGRLQFIDEPLCQSCGRPFAYDIGENGICVFCARSKPAFDMLRAALVYNDISARLVLRLKYGDQTDGIKIVSSWMANALPEHCRKPDFIVPVPLHYLRLVFRQFNQSALLARGLLSHCQGAFEPQLLERVRHTPQQKGLTGKERWKNVRGAFRVSPKWVSRVEGKSVLLVDDVFTTGSTIRACCAALRQAGAAQVYVVVLARVAGEEQLPI